jgi:hypothetical protein
MRTVLPLLLLLLPSLAAADDLSGGNASEGYRIQAKNGGTGIGLAEHVVVGADGGTTALTVSARFRLAAFQFGAAVPFATYRVPGGRDKDLGNIRLWSLFDLPYGSFDQSVGLRIHFNVGEGAYTWVAAGDELWPGAGIDAIWEARLGAGVTTWMLRGALGVHTAAGYDPYPDRYGRFQVAAGADVRLTRRFGLVGETSIQYWDPSPWEISALARADLIKGLRFRAGLVFPVAVWAGWTPADQPAGVRETTILLDATAAF